MESELGSVPVHDDAPKAKVKVKASSKQNLVPLAVNRSL